MPQQTILTDLAIRAVGRVPVWETQAANITSPNSPPPAADSGVSVQGSVLALIAVADEAPVTTWEAVLWAQMDGEGDRPTAWFPVLDASITDTGSLVWRVNCAGLRRLYLEMVAISPAGSVTISTAPCDTEGV